MDATAAAPAPSDDPRAARRATRLIFIVCGLLTAAWAPMVPFAKTRLVMDDATLGLVLLCLGAGALVAMPLTGLVMVKLGSRVAMSVAGVATSLLLPTLVLAPTPLTLGVCLFLFGSCIAALDVSMNAQAVVVEAKGSRPVMSSFHAMFSIGGLIGAAGVSALLAQGLSLVVCAGLLALISIGVVGTQFAALLPRSDDMRSSSGGGLRLPRGPAIVIGLLAFICFLAEGAMLDWSAVFLRFERGLDAATAGLGYAAFSVAMAVMRLVGDRLTTRLGPVNILRYGPALAAAGLALALLAPVDSIALAGFAIVGIGVANVVPVLISAAGRLPNPAINVPAVMTLGYAGMLAGPALIGQVADQSSLPIALGAVAAALLAITASANIANRR
jgi:predicted MFS family arabinose efflux permease